MSTPGGQMEPHRGTVVLVLGILSLVVAGIILGPIAWIMGNNDLKKMRAGQMDPSGESNTNLGKILGMVGTILNVVGCCITIGVLAIVIPMTIHQAQQEMPRTQPPFPGPAQPGELPDKIPDGFPRP